MLQSVVCQVLLLTTPPYQRVNESVVQYDHSALFPNLVTEVSPLLHKEGAR